MVCDLWCLSVHLYILWLGIVVCDLSTYFRLLVTNIRRAHTLCRYGSVLMGRGLANFKSVMKSFIVLIVTALAIGDTLALAPDLLKGN